MLQFYHRSNNSTAQSFAKLFFSGLKMLLPKLKRSTFRLPANHWRWNSAWAPSWPVRCTSDWECRRRGSRCSWCQWWWARPCSSIRWLKRKEKNCNSKLKIKTPPSILPSCGLLVYLAFSPMTTSSLLTLYGWTILLRQCSFSRPFR